MPKIASGSTASAPAGCGRRWVEYHLSQLDDPEGFAARLEKLHPLGVGDPASVAGGFVYLASDEAAWITGIALTIDGGVSCGLVPE